MEYLEGGELFERIVDDEDDLLESDCSSYVRQIVSGLEYLQSRGIVHLDIKPENIVLKSHERKSVDCRIKIIDFGSAKRLVPGHKVSAIEGTPEFMAPEVINFDEITVNTDQWSLGVLTYVLLSGYSPFLGDDDNMTMSNVISNKYHFDLEEFDEVSSEAKDFITRLLRGRAARRLTAGECLHHHWLREKSATTLTHRVKVSNLKKFLARRKVQNVGKALKVINVLKGAVRESTERNSSQNSISGLSGDSGMLTSELEDIVKECVIEEEKSLVGSGDTFQIKVTSCTDQNLAGLETTEREGGRGLRRTSTKAVPGTVRNLLSKFHTEGPSDDADDDVVEVKKKETDWKPRYQKASTRAAPGTVRSLRENFETK